MTECDTTLPITCHITPWFYKRMGMLAGMMLIFGLRFYKDGKWTWPKDNEIAQKHEWFQQEVIGGYDAAKKEGKLEAWIDNARKLDYPLTSKGEPEKWVAYAAKHGWPEKPHKHTEKEISAQFGYAGAMAFGAFLVGLHVLRNRNKKLIGHADHFITPEGKKVNYAEAYKIDKRPWAQKGLAYVYHRPGGASGTGNGSRAIIDDLKYDGAAKVLNLLMQNFNGDLIEKVEEEEESATEASEQSDEAK